MADQVMELPLLESWPRGDFMLHDFATGTGVAISECDADKLKMGGRQQRNGLVYTPAYVHRTFANQRDQGAC